MTGVQTCALPIWPVLLALTGSDSAVLSVSGAHHEAIVDRLHQDPERPLHFAIDGHPQYKYMPYWQVLTEPFTCFPVVDVA